jgi:hypothetical protein
VAATLRGTFVEAESAGTEETTGFNLEGVTVVEADPEETAGFDPEGGAINLDMPSAVAAENWVGKEVVVEGIFEAASTGERTPGWVFRVDSIDEA